MWVSISARLLAIWDNSDDALVQGYTLMGVHVNPESRGGTYQLLQVSCNSRNSPPGLPDLLGTSCQF